MAEHITKTLHVGFPFNLSPVCILCMSVLDFFVTYGPTFIFDVLILGNILALLIFLSSFSCNNSNSTDIFFISKLKCSPSYEFIMADITSDFSNLLLLISALGSKIQN